MSECSSSIDSVWIVFSIRLGEVPFSAPNQWSQCCGSLEAKFVHNWQLVLEFLSVSFVMHLFGYSISQLGEVGLLGHDDDD